MYAHDLGTFCGLGFIPDISAQAAALGSFIICCLQSRLIFLPSLKTVNIFFELCEVAFLVRHMLVKLM